MVKNFSKIENLITNIQDIILAYANGDFSKRLPISEEYDENDVIASGINMLGEELEEKSITKDYFLKILNNIPQIVFVFDNKKEIQFSNLSGKEFLNDLIDVFSFIDKEIFKHKKVIDYNLLKKKQHNFELKIQKDNGTIIYFFCTITKIKDFENTHFLFFGNDISFEKNEEKRIIKATLLGQELERKRLAYDIHDSLGQELSAIKMTINAMEKMKINSSVFKESLSNIHYLLDAAIHSVREISHNLIPSKFENKDIKECIVLLIKQLNNCSSINIISKITNSSFHLKDSNDELFLFRIIQEFLNNSLKYSKAKRIYVEINKNEKENTIHFLLKDDGIGFDLNKKSNTNGLNNLKYRLEYLNAKYTYKSQLLRGTTLEFKLNEKRN
jgi:signal transduction histidine kinase